ncbi:Metallo-beta-lactamase{ECO:0000313/EMBL:BAM70238,1} [Methanothermobacter wolfeii]|nr:Metallo-beta-lactamase{ECO:0000313/EMBL:BAM70238,1} [Methanothermobacter wolfeii]
MLYGDGMILETVKSGGISHNSYFLGSGGEAAVIDPRRDVDVYLDLAEGHGMNIRYIFEPDLLIVDAWGVLGTA